MMHLPSSIQWNIVQVTVFWEKVLSEPERQRLAENVAGHLKDAQPFLQKRTVSRIWYVAPLPS